jgi:hypothetical protein
MYQILDTYMNEYVGKNSAVVTDVFEKFIDCAVSILDATLTCTFD